MNAHAIYIECCTECPLARAHEKGDEIGHCDHPGMLSIEQLQVRLRYVPPKACPLRSLVVVLRVTT